MTGETKDILKVLFFLPFVIVAIVIFIFHMKNIDEDLSDFDKREAIYKNFENEFKLINLPPNTAVNKFERSGKHLSSILLTTRYRTEIEKSEFFDKLNQELVNKGWIFHRTENEPGFKTYYYCRGKFDASLSLETGQGIWADGADYWQLSFSLGLRTRPLFGNPLPENCLN